MKALVYLFAVLFALTPQALHTQTKSSNLSGFHRLLSDIELSRRSRKKPVGRQLGWRATTKEEDKAILKAFKKVRPPGHGVVARKVRAALPKNIKKKVRERTVIRRLAEKGIKPQRKLNKSEQSMKNAGVRVKFARKHLDKTAQDWKNDVQAVADIKEFTWYPHDLRPRLAQLRSSWTYMTDAEKTKPAFLRQKRWFKKADYNRTKKQKVFGLTASNGKVLAVPCPTPMTGERFAQLVRQKIKPFLKKNFPRKTSWKILLDGEKIFRSPVAKAALSETGVTVLANWPPYSPDLNPQENVWPWAENKLRQIEGKSGSFEDFADKCVKAVAAYPEGKKLIPSLAKRMQMCVASKGSTIMK